MADATLLVLDTNVVLDLWVFHDPAVRPLRDVLMSGACRWLGTAAMREELERVLAYPKIQAWMGQKAIQPASVLAQVDALMTLVPEPEVAPARCRDPDDQKFINLAWQQPCLLISKDHEVLRLSRVLLGRGVAVSAIFPGNP